MMADFEKLHGTVDRLSEERRSLLAELADKRNSLEVMRTQYVVAAVQ